MAAAALGTETEQQWKRIARVPSFVWGLGSGSYFVLRLLCGGGAWGSGPRGSTGQNQEKRKKSVFRFPFCTVSKTVTSRERVHSESEARRTALKMHSEGRMNIANKEYSAVLQSSTLICTSTIENPASIRKKKKTHNNLMSIWNRILANQSVIDPHRNLLLEQI